MPIRIRCPECQQLSRIPAGLAPERRVQCPKCNSKFQVKDITTVLQDNEDGVTGKASGPKSSECLAGATLGGFKIIEQIGKGGMGTVYKALQLSLDRFVAVKILPKQFAKDARFVERFMRESKVMSELSHPNIVTIFDRAQEDHLLYYAMEYVEGPSLRSVLRKTKDTLPCVETLRIIRLVADGLGYAHSQGVIHRDIKPENILISRTGVPKVSDFGIAAALDQMGGNTLTMTSSSMGTAVYAAPEQHEDAGSVDQRADIYSLGVMLYEMLTGKLPIGSYKRPSRINKNINPKFDKIIDTLLASDRDDRYQSVDALTNDLRSINSNGIAATSSISYDIGIMPDTEQEMTEVNAPQLVELAPEPQECVSAESPARQAVPVPDHHSTPHKSPQPEAPQTAKPRRPKTIGPITLSGKPGRKQLVNRIICPNCWHSFRPDDILFVAKHPELVGDPVAGSNEYLRFRPSRFNVAGEAFDPRGFPTTDLACPRCHLQLSDASLEVPPLFISIVGSPASGKSYFLTTMAWELRHMLPRANISFSDADPIANAVINDYERSLFFNSDPDKPTEIGKTQTDDPRLHRTTVIDGVPVRFPLPIQFALRPTPSHDRFHEIQKFQRNVVLYDNAGEDFLPSAEDVGSAVTRHLARSHILFVLFDPTQDPSVRTRCYGDDPQINFGLRPDGNTPSALMRQETLLREVSVRIRRYHGMSQTERIKKPLIVVIPKFDVLAKSVGVPIDDEPYHLESNPFDLCVDTERVESVSKIIENHLRTYCPAFVAAAESLSTTVRYIPISSLGRSPMLVTEGERKFYGICPKDIRPRWTSVPLLYSLCKWAPGLIKNRTVSPTSEVGT
jgi:serine/threonine protein kinase